MDAGHMPYSRRVCAVLLALAKALYTVCTVLCPVHTHRAAHGSDAGTHVHTCPDNNDAVNNNNANAANIRPNNEGTDPRLPTRLPPRTNIQARAHVRTLVHAILHKGWSGARFGLAYLYL